MVGLSLPHLRKLSNQDNYALAKKVVYSRQLDKALVVQQVAALQSFPIAAYDKTRTSFTANYLPLDARLTATRVAPSTG
jgi:hypothetical protein